MQNIMDYLDWRGDVSFACDSFNEVDNLIFSVLVYLDLQGIVPGEAEEGSVALSQVAELLTPTDSQSISPVTRSFFSQVPILLEKAAQSARFRDVRLSRYVDQVDFERTKQFSVVVFSINSGQHFVAFSGTDDTLTGWKEDMQMSFKDVVPAQTQAAHYLKNAMESLEGHFYLGGHSKGGNLAVYAGSHATPEMRDRIIAIYNNDGPGFQTSIIQSEGYQSIVARVMTFLPKSSVVGMLLEHCEEYKVVNSDEIGMMQHNAFSWEVKGPNFVYEEGLSKNSLSLNTAIRSWLDQVPMEERSEFVEALFELLQATGARTVSELSQERLAGAKTMITTYRNLDPLTQSHLKNILETLFSESQKVLRSSISEEVSSLISKTISKKKENV
ncbi:MAG: DUF2974 domain-containing protein [Anaerolineaceae bacterium]